MVTARFDVKMPDGGNFFLPGSPSQVLVFPRGQSSRRGTLDTCRERHIDERLDARSPFDELYERS
jgi:hypothetical protein